MNGARRRPLALNISVMTRFRAGALIALFGMVVGVSGCAAGGGAVAPAPVPVVGRQGPPPARAVVPAVLAAVTTASVSTNRLRAATSGAWRTAPANVSAALYDSATGQFVVLHPTVRAYMASTAKLPLLLTAYVQARKGNRTAGRTAATYAPAMIEHSDNTAATKIWQADGGNAPVRAFTAAIGMTQTVDARTLWMPWDGRTTSARDLVILLRALVLHTSPIAAGDSKVALGLMSSVERAQAWGVPAGVPAADRTAVKNGWVPVPGHGWTVNTTGVVWSGGHFYCLAVVSTGQPSFAAGITAVERITRDVARNLG
ncbi:MAG: hypothetical protein QOK14_584 [Frankiaceae bacterium]|nr:hypothetical protein [Frankiaceae bacterium]